MATACTRALLLGTAGCRSAAPGRLPAGSVGTPWSPLRRCPPGPCSVPGPGWAAVGWRWAQLHGTAPARAGHNRWSKVKNVKGPRDAARSRQFQRLALLLRTAVREGGPDPALNPQLANLVEQCRARNMPKATIQAAIHGGEKASSPPCRVLFEARGPGGSALLLEVLTDNPRRCQQELRQALTRHGGTLADGARHSFEEQGVVQVAPRDLQGRLVTLEVALELALEAGAQDVLPEEEEEEEEEPTLKFLCAVPALGQVRARLEAAGLRPLSAAVEYRPRGSRLELAPEPRQELEKLLQALSNLCPDLLRTYHNSQ